MPYVQLNRQIASTIATIAAMNVKGSLRLLQPAAAMAGIARPWRCSTLPPPLANEGVRLAPARERYLHEPLRQVPLMARQLC